MLRSRTQDPWAVGVLDEEGVLVKTLHRVQTRAEAFDLAEAAKANYDGKGEIVVRYIP